ERRAREEVQQPEQRAALAVEEVLDLLRVDAGRRHPRAEAVDREHSSGEQEPASQLRDPPGVGEPGKHQLSSVPAWGSASAGRAGRPSGRRFWFFGLRGFGSRRSVSVPPAASTFSRAVAEAPCTVIVSFFVSSPTPSSLTSLRSVRIRSFALSDSGV